MSQALPIFISKKALSFDELAKLSKNLLADKTYQLHFSLALDPKDLHIVALFPPNVALSKGVAPGEFFEGLWQETALELFIGSSNSDGYTEINLAPHGAWWLQKFSGLRQRATTPKPSARNFTQFVPQQWLSALSVSRDQLNLPTLDALTANVTAAVAPGNNLLSWNKLPAGKADFHQKQLRTTVKQLSV